MAGRTMPDGTISLIVIPGDPDNSPIVQITGAPRFTLMILAESG